MTTLVDKAVCSPAEVSSPAKLLGTITECGRGVSKLIQNTSQNVLLIAFPPMLGIKYAKTDIIH